MPEPTYIPHRVSCPTCRGTGTVFVVIGNRRPLPEVTCTPCKGTGMIELQSKA